MSVVDKTIQLVIGAKDKTANVLNAARNNIAKFGKAAKVAGAAAAAAFIASAAAVAAVVAKTLDYGDNLAKTADKLGLTTEALAGMRHAGELAGVSVQGMDNSVKFMNKNLSDAVLGTGEAKVAFEQLGLSAERLKKDGPEKAFEKIVAKLEGVENASDRVNYAMKIFGKSGGDILNMTASGLRAAKEEADAFGLSINRADAKKMEDVNDSITRIKSAFGGAGIALTTSLLDPLKTMAARLVELAKNGTLAEWGTKIGEVAGTAIQWVTDMVLGAGKIPAAIDLISGSFGGLFDMLATGFWHFSSVLNKTLQHIFGILQMVSFNSIPGLDDLRQSFKAAADYAETAASKSSKSWTDNSNKVVAAWDTLSKAADKPAAAMKKLRTPAEQVAAAMKKTANAAKETIEPVKQTGVALEKTAKQAAKAKKEADDYQLALEKLASNERIKSMEFAAKFNISALKADADKTKAILQNIGTEITSTGDLINNMFGQLNDTNSFTQKWAIEDQIKAENEKRNQAFDDAHKLNQQQIQLNDAKLKQIASGGGLIKIDAAGLEPALEMIMWQVLEKIQIQASAAAQDLLLGIK